MVRAGAVCEAGGFHFAPCLAMLGSFLMVWSGSFSCKHFVSLRLP